MKIHISHIAAWPLLFGLADAFAPTQRAMSSTSTTRLDMATSGQLLCRPIGIGAAAPHTVITNLDLESVVETNDEWIKARTGISERRVLLENETIRSLGTEAAKQALDMAGIAAEDLDLVICATSSADDMFGDATVIAAEIG